MLSWRVLGVECYLNRHDAVIYITSKPSMSNKCTRSKISLQMPHHSNVRLKVVVETAVLT